MLPFGESRVLLYKDVKTFLYDHDWGTEGCRKMIRTFHPVGQGTFVTEQFEQGQCIVYDCGTGTSKWLLRDIIERCFAEGEKIDCVFISSIDIEHAGGLQWLLERCRVERVFLPQLNEEEKALTLLKHVCEGGETKDFIGQLISDPKAALKEYRNPEQSFPLLAMIAGESEKDKNISDAKLPIRLLPIKSIAGFHLFIDENLDWIYEVAVHRQKKRIERLKEELQNIGLAASAYETVQSVTDSWADLEIRKKFYKVFKSMKHPFCAVSMALYSGPEEKDYDLYEQFTEEGKWSCYARIRPGCLYMGNLQLSGEEERARLEASIGVHMEHTGCLMLPGHGSQSLYHEDILPKHNAIVVATADNENLTGEPHALVIRSVMQHKIPFYLVTELPGSMLQFYVNEKGEVIDKNE